ncbi:hypothetical protein [Promineifilum sp.]|uniref:hypothetical protein n=1 Tax=Promineifilum sp. TaxID=2664178 RepID=UPI0035B0A09A
MTLTLELPSELEYELAEEAERRGLSLPEYALLVLTTGLTAEKRPTTGAELVAYWREEGLIGSRPDIADGQSYARALRQQAEKR